MGLGQWAWALGGVGDAWDVWWYRIFSSAELYKNMAESDRTSLSSSQEAWIEQGAIFTSP